MLDMIPSTPNNSGVFTENSNSSAVLRVVKNKTGPLRWKSGFTMNDLSITIFGLLLALLLIQIRQKHAGQMTFHEMKNSVKNDGGKEDSNGQVSAVDLVDLKFWKSHFFQTSSNIRFETKKNKKQTIGKLLTFGDGSTMLKVQKNVDFHTKKNLKSAAGGKKASETKSSKRHVQNPRNRYPRSTTFVSNGDGKHQQNSNCNKNENFTLSCHGEMSCRKRCQRPRHVVYQAQLTCFCDEDCEFFRDCCADYDAFCGASGKNVTNSTSQKENTVENLVSQENRDLWKCYEGEELRATDGIWMIGSCPRSWPEDDVLYRCRDLSIANRITRDNYRYLPVYTSNGRVYHNRFCAQCNGVAAKNISSYTLSIKCPFSPPQDLSLKGKLRYLLQYCSKKIKWKANMGHPRRYCIHFETNKESGLSGERTSLERAIQCHQGKPRVVSTANKIYRNVECARYFGEVQCVSCGPNISVGHWEDTDSNTESSQTKPLSLLFDFNPGINSLKVKTQCGKNKVYDHYLEVCTEGISPGLPINASHLSEFRVALWVLPPPRLSTFLDKITANYFLAKILGVSQQQLKNFDTQNFPNPTMQKIQFTLEMTQNERLLPSIKRFLDFTSPFNISLVGQTFTVVKATSRILSCVNWQKYDRSEYAVLHDGSSAVSIKTTGEVFHVKDYYINKAEESITANGSQAIFVCRLPQISNCSGVYILIKEGEFRVLMNNKSIFVNASKQVYDWSEYTWINKSVLVCENFSNTYYKSTDDPVLTTITIVCMSLSIIGLVFVLVTYSLFSELRTPPGINLMNLSVSILLAQLLWLLGSGQTDTPMACTVIAVILHYLFLVSFVWTSIIAFDTWRAFSAKGRRPLADSKSERMKHCFRHMTVGWLPALAYVGICVVLDLTNTADVGYMSKTRCWMAGKWASLYFFAVPVIMLLVFNLVFFILTFRAIKVTTAQASVSSDHNTPKYFGIYVRIASLMGFTWVFGFAAPFERSLLYPFVILNGLQGVYIALAFPLSKRARSLYKEWLKSTKPSQETTVELSTSRAKAQDSEFSGKYDDTKL